MPDYADLIERLEGADHGSRALDCDVARALGERVFWPRLGVPLLHDSGDPVPAYTTSLDAALSLVPEGWYGRVWFSALPPHIAHNNNRASIWSPDPEQEHAFFGPSGNAATAPLALTIAALKARQAAS